MFNTSIKDQVRSKGFLFGYGLMALGIYVIVFQQDVTGGLSVMGVGGGIIGIRDKMGV